MHSFSEYTMNVFYVHWVSFCVGGMLVTIFLLLLFLHLPGPSNHPRLCHGPQRTAYPSSRWPVWSWICPHHKLRCQHSSSGCSPEERRGGSCSIRGIHRLRCSTGLSCHSLPAAHPWCLPNILIMRAGLVKNKKLFCLWLNNPCGM